MSFFLIVVLILKGKIFKGVEALYNDLFIENKMAWLHNPIFLFKRLLLSLTIVIIENNAIQLLLLSLSSIITIWLYSRYPIFKRRINNFSEVFNEICFILLCYQCYAYSALKNEYFDKKIDMSFTANLLTNFSGGMQLVISMIINASSNILLILY